MESSEASLNPNKKRSHSELENEEEKVHQDTSVAVVGAEGFFVLLVYRMM